MTMPPQPPAGPPPARPRPGALGWARAHKGAAAGAAAAAGVVVYGLWKRHQNAAAGAAAGTTADSTGAAGSGVQGTFDNSGQNVYDAIESQITALQEQIGQSSTNAAGSGTTAGAPAGATVTVPSVDGKQVDAALAALSASGLTGVVSAKRNPADTYIVNSQTPGAGARVAAGSNVRLGIAPHRFGK